MIKDVGAEEWRLASHGPIEPLRYQSVSMTNEPDSFFPSWRLMEEGRGREMTSKFITFLSE